MNAIPTMCADRLSGCDRRGGLKPRLIRWLVRTVAVSAAVTFATDAAARQAKFRTYTIVLGRSIGGASLGESLAKAKEAWGCARSLKQTHGQGAATKGHYS
jgi:hypothetical protein